MSDTTATSSTPAWEQSKENVQPRARGRDPAKLQKVLMERNNREDRSRQLQDTEREFEERLQSIDYDTDDNPLKHWIKYIEWAEQNYSTDGPDDKLFQLYERCAHQFQDDPRYANSLSYLRVWIKYADKHADPADVFKFLYSKKIGTGLALFYMAWASVAEQRGNYAFADKIYKQGIERNAKPKERLQQKQRHFMKRMTKLWIKHTNGEDLFTKESSVLEENQQPASSESAPDLDQLTNAAKKNARLPCARQNADLENSFSRGAPTERCRKPLGSLEGTGTGQSTGSGTQPQEPQASASGQQHSIPVYVDDEEENGNQKLNEQAGGTWQSLAPFNERTKENTQQRSRWNSGVDAEADANQSLVTAAKPSFSIFEENTGDINEAVATNDRVNRSVAADLDQSVCQPAQKKARKGAKSTNAIPRYDVSMIKGKLTASNPRALEASRELNNKAYEILNGEFDSDDEGASLSFEEVRMLHYVQKSDFSGTHHTLNQASMGATKDSNNHSCESQQLQDADNEDMTINTKLAMEDLSELFASPNAKFEAARGTKTSRQPKYEGYQPSSSTLANKYNQVVSNQQQPTNQTRSEDEETANTAGIERLMSAFDEEKTESNYDEEYQARQVSNRSAIQEPHEEGGTARPTPQLSPIAAERSMQNNTLVSTALNNKLFSENQRPNEHYQERYAGAHPQPNAESTGAADAAVSHPVRQLSFAIYEENQEEEEEEVGDENAPPAESSCSKPRETPNRHPHTMDQNAILSDITPDEDRQADLVGGVVYGEDDNTEDPSRFYYIPHDEEEEGHHQQQ